MMPSRSVCSVGWMCIRKIVNGNWKYDIATMKGTIYEGQK